MSTAIPIDGKPNKGLTIEEINFEAPLPFVEGHVLRVNEANVLNQTYHENLRNNFAKTVRDARKTAEENGSQIDEEAMRKDFAEYLQSYDFGSGRGGFRTGDPVLQEAMAIARDLVREALKSKGYKLSDVGAIKISELAKKAVETNPDIMAEAQVRVQRDREVGLVNADELLSSIKP